MGKRDGKPLVGQFRFSGWMDSPNPESAVKSALRNLSDVKLISFAQRKGQYHAVIVASAIPEEAWTWFDHFKRKGIEAAIVKKAGKAEYAVFRMGEDALGGVPEVFADDELYIVEKTEGFMWSGPRARASKKAVAKIPEVEDGSLVDPPVCL